MNLETIDLSKKYKSKTAVDQVNLFLNQGESVGLLGPNGAGKSTTISMISTLVKPTAGDVKLNGKSIVSKPHLIRGLLGVVPQDIALYEQLSAAENLSFFGNLYGLKGKALEQKVDEVLELVGLSDRRKDLVKTYSGGMKRRINIAAALLHEPQMIIMDEPTVGIDPQSRNHILETVRLLNRDKQMTVLYTSHYMEEVEQLCDRVYIMDHGKIIASGSNDELKSILSTEDTILVQLEETSAAFIEALNQMDDVHQVLELDSDRSLKLIVSQQAKLFGQLFQAAERHGAKIETVSVQKPSLEDIFLHLTGRNLRD